MINLRSLPSLVDYMICNKWHFPDVIDIFKYRTPHLFFLEHISYTKFLIVSLSIPFSHTTELVNIIKLVVFFIWFYVFITDCECSFLSWMSLIAFDILSSICICLYAAYGLVERFFTTWWIILDKWILGFLIELMESTSHWKTWYLMFWI